MSIDQEKQEELDLEFMRKLRAHIAEGGAYTVTILPNEIQSGAFERGGRANDQADEVLTSALYDALHFEQDVAASLNKHPRQPVYIDERGTVRFRPNKIVEWAERTGKIDLNDVAIRAAKGEFDREDQIQLAQLIGYSIDGAADLPYMDRETIDEAFAEYVALKDAEDDGGE